VIVIQSAATPVQSVTPVVSAAPSSSLAVSSAPARPSSLVLLSSPQQHHTIVAMEDELADDEYSICEEDPAEDSDEDCTRVEVPRRGARRGPPRRTSVASSASLQDRLVAASSPPREPRGVSSASASTRRLMCGPDSDDNEFDRIMKEFDALAEDEEDEDEDEDDKVDFFAILKGLDDAEEEDQSHGQKSQKDDDSEEEDDDSEEEDDEDEDDEDEDDEDEEATDSDSGPKDPDNGPSNGGSALGKGCSSSGGGSAPEKKSSSSQQSSSGRYSSNKSACNKSTVPTKKRSVDEVRVSRAVKIPPEVLPKILSRVGRFLAAQDLVSLVLLCRSAAQAVFPLLAKRTTLSAKVGKPLLHWAAERGYTRGHHSLLTLVQRLRHGGANINHVHNGHTPLTMAITHRHEHIVAELVDAGAKQVVAGVPPALHLAVKYAVRRDTAVAEMLLKCPRADVNYIGTSREFRHPPLFEAALRINCAAKLAKCLIEAGADPSLANKEGMTPLHAAAMLNSAKMVETLLASRWAKPNVRTFSDWQTPLHLAVKRGEPRVIKALVSDGRTQLYVLNRDRQLPIHLLLSHEPPLLDYDELRALLNPKGWKVSKWRWKPGRSRGYRPDPPGVNAGA
jgi:hypothetical protein